MAAYGNSGLGKNRDHRNDFHPYQRQPTKEDIFCVYCGIIIRNGRENKLARCPRNECNRSVPFTAGYGHNGWGRCVNPSCWRFTYREFCYCETCGHANRDSIAREHRLKLAEIQKQTLLEKERAAAKEKENEELRESLAKAEEALSHKDEAYFKPLHKRDQSAPPKKSDKEAISQDDATEIQLAETAIEIDDKSMDVDSLLKDD